MMFIRCLVKHYENNKYYNTFNSLKNFKKFLQQSLIIF